VPLDQLLGEGPEDVDVGDPPPFLGLDRTFGEAMPADPDLQVLAQPDHVQERLLHQEAAGGAAAVVGVEVAMESDAAGFGVGDRLLDLAALEIPFFYFASASRIRRLSVCRRR